MTNPITRIASEERGSVFVILMSSLSLFFVWLGWDGLVAWWFLAGGVFGFAMGFVFGAHRVYEVALNKTDTTHEDSQKIFNAILRRRK
ncbi:MAG: hypothetical protein M0Q95_17170 [Porticoccaceae bacterium]|nr:hypothetical protein [Porticoccaceae bacterium]